jgi:hypothetical protein
MNPRAGVGAAEKREISSDFSGMYVFITQIKRNNKGNEQYCLLGCDAV